MNTWWQVLVAALWNGAMIGLPMIAVGAGGFAVGLFLTGSPVVAAILGLTIGLTSTWLLLRGLGVGRRSEPLAMTLQASQRMFDGLVEFKSPHRRLFGGRKTDGETSSGRIRVALVADRHVPRYLSAVSMELDQSVEPDEAAAALEIWYRLADEIARDMDVKTYSVATHETLYGGRRWFEQRIKPPQVSWGVDQAHFAHHRTAPAEGRVVSFWVFRPKDGRRRLEIESALLSDAW